jgi:hypothetical protein
MSGVAVIVALLKASTPITTLVAPGKIIAGDIPLNTILPAIAVTEVSGMPSNTVAMREPNKMHTERVQVSVLCKGPQTAQASTGYQGTKTIAKLLLAACPHTHGRVNGIDVVSIRPDTEGPDLSDDALALYSSSRDFIVNWRS